MEDVDEICKTEAFLKNEHLISKDCWCCPILEYVNKETDIEVWVHNRKQ